MSELNRSLSVTLEPLYIRELPPPKVVFDLDDLPDPITVRYQGETIELDRATIMALLAYLKGVIPDRT